MPYYCTVPRCTSMAGKAKNVSFHQFPRDEELAKLWNRILKRGKPYTKYSKVCSLHFKPEDYTITSVGKNKGQWRTLRKDAIPSQNLPSESPAPYTRRSSGCWVPSQPNLTDPLVQQQMAQAIYMQTMLAMQTAGASDSLASGEPPPQTPESTKPSPSSSSVSEIELLLRRDTDTPKEVTYKCHECTKCFKDPDVFLLHKRTHKNDSTLNVEKENYSANIQDRDETLRANPILANLLKTSMRLEPETNMANILTVENQIMAALASNMEAYIRTLSSMLASQNSAIETGDNEDRGQSDYEDETKDDDDCENAAKVKCEANDMFVDTNEHDTPMDEDEDGEHRNNEDEVIQDENKEEISNSFGITEGENRIEMLANQNIMYESEVSSRDDNYTIKDETSEARDDTFDENLSNAREIHEASNDAHNSESSSSRTELSEARTDAIVHEYYDVHDNQIRNKTENGDTAIDENRMYTDEDNIADDTARKAYEANDALVDVRDAIDYYTNKDEMIDVDTSKDEMVNDDTRKYETVDDGSTLVQGDPACDNVVETVELDKVDIEFET